MFKLDKDMYFNFAEKLNEFRSELKDESVDEDIVLEMGHTEFQYFAEDLNEWIRENNPFNLIGYIKQGENEKKIDEVVILDDIRSLIDMIDYLDNLIIYKEGNMVVIQNIYSDKSKTFKLIPLRDLKKEYIIKLLKMCVAKENISFKYLYEIAKEIFQKPFSKLNKNELIKLFYKIDLVKIR